MRWLAVVWAPVALGVMAFAGPAHGGVYLAPGLKWAVFSLRPQAVEPTPNYYGYGGVFSIGYSIRQILDFGAFGQYAPGTRKEARPGKADATLLAYGGETALRLSQAVYVGLRGGVGKYRLDRTIDATEVAGTWAGHCGGFSIGALAKFSKVSYLQTTFDVMHFVVASKSDPDLGKRRIDAFGVSISYVFNGYTNYLIENTIFKDFLDSVMFF